MTKNKLGSEIKGEEYLVLHEFAKKAKGKLPKVNKMIESIRAILIYILLKYLFLRMKKTIAIIPYIYIGKR